MVPWFGNFVNNYIDSHVDWSKMHYLRQNQLKNIFKKGFFALLKSRFAENIDKAIIFEVKPQQNIAHLKLTLHTLTMDKAFDNQNARSRSYIKDILRVNSCFLNRIIK